ncbi:MAG: hypothetical protein QOE70_4465 [Chthoniobacter sp.]|nr:hypothetical protein [Chthoniobacter sp.]
MPANLDAQVVELFNRVNKDLALWESLTRDYDVDLFCGFFMTETDEGLEISAETMRILSDRRIKVGFCIYAPLEDEPKVEQSGCTEPGDSASVPGRERVAPGQ